MPQQYNEIVYILDAIYVTIEDATINNTPCGISRLTLFHDIATYQMMTREAFDTLIGMLEERNLISIHVDGRLVAIRPSYGKSIFDMGVEMNAPRTIPNGGALWP